MGYGPTVFPSRRGESLKDLQNRADLFVEAWTSRVEDQYQDVKCVVIFAHAASVIALGRAVGHPLPRSAFDSAHRCTDDTVDRKQGIRRISRMRNDIPLPPEVTRFNGTTKSMRGRRMGSSLPRKSRLHARWS